MARYRADPINKAKAKVAQAAWREKNKEYVKEYEKRPHIRTKRNEQHKARYAANPEKFRKAARDWQKAHPENSMRVGRKTRYGIPHNAVLELLEKQKHMCVICDKALTERTANVDHSHSTGKVRGLLCHPCNACLGALERENGSWQTKALAYLDNRGF